MLTKVVNTLSSLLTLLLMQSSSRADTKLERATFAGGCFWCMEPPFEKLEGVVEVILYRRA